MSAKARCFLIALLALPAMAQTTLVTGKLQTYNPGVAPNALGNYVEFALTNCGNNTPTVSGSAVLLSKPIDFYPDSTGALTATVNGGSAPSLYGNDVINCGGAFTSRYSVRYFVGGVAQGPAKFYLVSSTTQFNLTTAIPIGLQPPLSPPYPNLTTCQPGSYSNGLNPDLSAKCLNLPSGASNAVVVNPTGTQEIANQPLVLDGPITGQVSNFLSVNSIQNAALQAGADIFTQAQNAFTACSSNCTVYIPAGSYTTAATLTLPNTQNTFRLQLDPAAVINYVGTANAIEGPTITTGSNHLDGITGGWIKGNVSAKNGIHINPINNFYIDHVKISGFTNATDQTVGNAIYDEGGNSVEIEDNSIFGNDTGIAGTEQTGYSSIAVHIFDNDISANNTWAIVTFDAHVSATQENSWSIENNVIEGNGVGGIDLAHSNEANIDKNHFEQTGNNVRLNNGYNGTRNKVRDNFFIGPAGGTTVYLVNGFNTTITGNYESPNSTSTCFLQISNASDVDERDNTVASANRDCWPGQIPGWSSQFNHTATLDAIVNHPGTQVSFPNGITAAATIQAPTIMSTTGNVQSGKCFQMNTSGSLICSGAGAPSISCTIGGSLWLNQGATTGTYPYYVCRNGTWVGQATIY